MDCASLLLVTAHPDDEAMFFAPTISRLLQQGTSIHILCLSNGEKTKHKMLFNQHLLV
jgi:N-acetylglucosaminylphosphatidylinositol deacetylase